MPFYEYKCDSCGHHFELMQRINEDPVKACEACGATVRRLIFPSAIVYKGSGFYSTEYGRSRVNVANGSGASSDGEGKSNSSSSAESAATSDGTSPATPKSSTKDSTGPRKPVSGEAAA